MTSPLFSVCIPNYNYAQYIGQTIESVLSQTFTDFEIVIADNASTDDSVDVVESFRSEKLRIFRNNYNIGFAPNLQRVTQYARGRFLILLSSDDLMFPNALQVYREVIESQGDRADSTVICAATDLIDSNGNKTYIAFKRRGEVFVDHARIQNSADLDLDGSFERLPGKTILHSALTKGGVTSIFCATAYARSLWSQVEGYDTRYNYLPDNIFLQKILACDSDYVFVRSRLFAYRIHSSNQEAIARSGNSLLKQLDGYMRTVNTPQKILDELSVKRSQLIQNYVTIDCFREALTVLAAGHWRRALQICVFAFAAYPGMVLRTPVSYPLGFILALGPLGIVAAKCARFVRSKFRGDWSGKSRSFGKKGE